MHLWLCLLLGKTDETASSVLICVLKTFLPCEGSQKKSISRVNLDNLNSSMSMTLSGIWLYNHREESTFVCSRDMSWLLCIVMWCSANWFTWKTAVIFQEPTETAVENNENKSRADNGSDESKESTAGISSAWPENRKTGLETDENPDSKNMFPFEKEYLWTAVHLLGAKDNGNIF